MRLAFALRDRIRVIDGLYVALADELDCALVTTDRRLAASDAPCEIRIPQPGGPTGVPVPTLRTGNCDQCSTLICGVKLDKLPQISISRA